MGLTTLEVIDFLKSYNVTNVGIVTPETLKWS